MECDNPKFLTFLFVHPSVNANFFASFRVDRAAIIEPSPQRRATLQPSVYDACYTTLLEAKAAARWL